MVTMGDDEEGFFQKPAPTGNQEKMLMINAPSLPPRVSRRTVIKAAFNLYTFGPTA